MLPLALAIVLMAQQPDRTPAIYRCPVAEAEGTRFAEMIDADGFGFLCVDPKPGPAARKAAAGKVAFVQPASIDTRANRMWRDATVAFAVGKLSPREWLARTAGLRETVHFLSSPATPQLRPSLGDDSVRAVFAEILLLSWPGRPCLTSGDLWLSRYLPGPGRLESWILAMNDLMGPMLQYRHDSPQIVTGRPVIVRADGKPGLLVFRQTRGAKTLTFFFNNGAESAKLPPIKLDHVTMNRGLDLDGSQPTLRQSGFFIEETDETSLHLLEYAPSPVDNPLKGLVPYAGEQRGRFPHSMEFGYLPLSALVVGYDRYDWRPLDALLESVASRGHQTVFRVFLEYPGKREGIPAFLLQSGLKVHRYRNTNTQPSPAAESITPDYEDANLRRVLKSFIAALGRRYDGDPRVGFITAGLLGTWGEWHDYPHTELFASRAVQKEVLDAYEAAFKTTPILLRYPAGAADAAYAETATRRFGYHDDSFAWATLDTGRAAESWFFVPKLKEAGPQALAKWQSQPIGGEIRPEAWGKVFDETPGDPGIQSFPKCVQETHVTWLMDSGMFMSPQDPDRVKRAEVEVRRMGYDFHAIEVTVCGAGSRKLEVTLALENLGVAPFYYDWRPELGLIGPAGKVEARSLCRGSLKGLLPGGPPRVWNEAVDISRVPAGRYNVAVRIPNPMPGGHPLRFANKTQDADAQGWLTLEPIALR